MAEDPLHDIIEAVSARLKTELETQLQAVSERQRQALEEQRARIETEAEQLWAPQLQAARTEVEQQAIAAAAARAALADLEELLSRERSLVESSLESSLESSKDHRLASGLAGPPNVSRLLQGLRDVDAADTVSDSLTAVLRAARSEATRSALYVANGSRLEQWAADNGTTITPVVHDVDASNDSIAVDAFRRTQVVRKNGTACAIPLLLDGAPVAVLYGESDPERQ